MTGKQRKARDRRLLDMAMGECWVGHKRENRAMFELLKKQGYSVAGGYRRRLESLLDYVRRAEGAIKSLDTKTE